MAAGSDPENPLEAACGFSPPCQGLWGMTCPQIVTGLGCKSHNQSVKGRKEGGRKPALSRHLPCAGSLVAFISYRVSWRYKFSSPS